MDPLSERELHDLMKLFRSSMFKSRSNGGDEIVNKCLQLFKRDYPAHIIIENENGLLSSSYPSKIFIPQRSSAAFCASMPTTIDELDELLEPIEKGKLKNYMLKARAARCRARFPIPVIYYRGKYICRSATLSGGPEIYGRAGLDLLFMNNSENSRKHRDNEDNQINNNDEPAAESDEPPLFDSNAIFTYARKQDIELLKYLNVGLICDLMVERKKVKFGLNVTSSEKADKKLRYREFNIICLPYPGCEFFREIRNREYRATGIRYNWSQDFVDSSLYIPDAKITGDLNINWNRYQQWDIVEMTSNYLKLLLMSLVKNKKSVLIHCISGWDRTPLFISLLRLSLWADGKIHQSLSSFEITYLTLAYDWYLFGHNLSDRLSKGEEILFFCFYFLKYMERSEFSIDHSVKSELCIETGDELDGEIIFNSSWSLNSCASDAVSESINSDELNKSSRTLTKPVEIPPKRTSRAQPLEPSSSPSSIKSESWQIISYNESFTDIGSFKLPSISNDASSPLDSANGSFINIDRTRVGTSTKDEVRRESRDERGIGSNTVRRSKLEEVRKFFFDAYLKVIFKNGQDVSPHTLSYLQDHFNGRSDKIFQQTVRATN